MPEQTTAHRQAALLLEKTLNQALRFDPAVLEKLAPLAGSAIQLRLQGFPEELILLADEQGIIVLDHARQATDVQVTAPPITLLRVLMQRDATLATDPEIQITGQQDIAETLLAALHELHFDWEEAISRFTGDIPAHALGNLFRNGRNYMQARWQTAQLNLSEYLQEEIHILPPRAAMDDFIDQMQDMDICLARLEQRITTMENGN